MARSFHVVPLLTGFVSTYGYQTEVKTNRKTAGVREKGAKKLGGAPVFFLLRFVVNPLSNNDCPIMPWC